MSDPRSGRAVEVAERLADDKANDNEVEEAYTQAREAGRAISQRMFKKAFRREWEAKEVVLARATAGR